MTDNLFEQMTITMVYSTILLFSPIFLFYVYFTLKNNKRCVNVCEFTHNVIVFGLTILLIYLTLYFESNLEITGMLAGVISVYVAFEYGKKILHNILQFLNIIIESDNATLLTEVKVLDYYLKSPNIYTKARYIRKDLYIDIIIKPDNVSLTDILNNNGKYIKVFLDHDLEFNYEILRYKDAYIEFSVEGKVHLAHYIKFKVFDTVIIKNANCLEINYSIMKNTYEL